MRVYTLNLTGKELKSLISFCDAVYCEDDNRPAVKQLPRSLGDFLRDAIDGEHYHLEE